MEEFISTVTSEGQITIPMEVREHLGIKTHDKIAFVLDQDGTVRLRVLQYPTITSLSGVAGSLSQLVSKQKMLQIAHEDRFVEQ